MPGQFQKRLQGALFGASNPAVDIPWLIDMYSRGMLKLDELVTSRNRLDQVAQGYDDLHVGCVRVATHRGVTLTGRHSTSRRVSSQEIPPCPMMIPARMTVTGTPPAASRFSTSRRLRK